MGTEETRYLETSSDERSLRWALGSAISVRTYELKEQLQPWFCVPMRAAELIYVVEGEVCLEMGPARQQVRIGPSSAAIILGGTPHLLHSASGTKCLVVDIAEEALDVVRAPRTLGIIEVDQKAFCGGGDERCVRLFDSIMSRPGDELREQLFSVYRRFEPNGLHAFEPSHSTRKMLDVKARLERLYMDPVDLSSLAKESRLDRFYLLRSFKKNFGVPPLAYVRFLRLDSFVRAMMMKQDRSLIELAGESGFGDYSTFSRRVRKRLGKSPSQLVIR